MDAAEPAPQHPFLDPLDVDMDDVDADSPMQPTGPTPLPKLQSSILFLLLFCEPITASVIFPFVAKLVGEMDIAKGDQSKIGYYVGLIESLFYFAQALTTLQWGLLSDRIGRRPVILIGELGLALSMLTFGLSTSSFWATVFARSLAGFLNGNLGVVKTVLGEITDSTNRARAFSLFPVTWIVGSTIGPLIGGALQHPAERFPTSIFGGSAFWIRYPYLLPCACAAAISGTTWLLGFLFLKETLDRKSHPDSSSQYQSLPQDSPVLATNPSIALEYERAMPESRKPTLRDVLIRPVIYAAINYALLGFLDIAVFALATVFFAVPVESGGLGYDPPKIGVLFSILGIASGAFQLLFFPALHRRFGSRRLLTVAFLAFFVLFPLFVIMHQVAVGSPKGSSDWRIYALVGVMVGMFPLVDMGYSCSFMFVTAASPSPHHLGTVNGLAQTAVSMVRAIGPAGTTTLFALSNEKKWLRGYAVYWFFVAFSFVGLGSVWWLPDSDEVEKAKERRPTID